MVPIYECMVFSFNDVNIKPSKLFYFKSNKKPHNCKLFLYYHPYITLAYKFTDFNALKSLLFKELHDFTNIISPDKYFVVDFIDMSVVYLGRIFHR